MHDVQQLVTVIIVLSDNGYFHEQLLVKKGYCWDVGRLNWLKFM